MSSNRSPGVPPSLMLGEANPRILKLSPLQRVKALTTGLVAAPPMADVSLLVGGWADGDWRFLNVGGLEELQVLAEQQHILGILDGRLLATATTPGDLATVTIPAGTVVGAVAGTQRFTIPVPPAEVWFIQAVALHSPAESAPMAGEIVTCNFRTTVWPDTAVVPNALGLPYFGGSPQDYVWTINDEIFDCEFSIGSTAWMWWGTKNIQTMLRIPGGESISLEAILTGANAGANLVADMRLYGFKGKLLVT
jgi:hypothetical protein